MWVAVGTVVALGVVAAHAWRDGDDAVLPPVRAPELTGAVRAAQCRLSSVRPRASVHAPAARPGVYDQRPDPAALTAATHTGTIVVAYRPGLDDEGVSRLEAMQGSVPQGTILTPGPPAMRFQVEISAARRVLSCPDLRDAALDALRLFRGRYLGSSLHS